METIRQTLDVFSLAHAAGGFLMGSLGVPRPVAYLVIFAIEIFEMVATALGSEFFNENPLDTLLDIVIGIGAYEIGRLS